MIENQWLSFGGRVQVIGLKEMCLLGDWFKKKAKQRDFLVAGNLGKAAVQLRRVGAVIGRQTNAGNQYLGAAGPGSIDHGVQIVAQLGQGQAAQAIVGAERNDDDGRFVLGKCRRQSGAPASSGFAGDRQIGNAIIQLLFAQALAEQGWPGLLLTDAVTGGERVTHDQNRFAGQGGQGREEQYKQEESEPHGRYTGG